jgi:ATP-dependent helicase/nuclease subunit A
VPVLVRALDDVQDPPPLSVTAPNREQAAAIEAPGVVFVSAGAGTGKTTVLVERYVRAICDRGLGIDSILVITYTERAAGELWSRIRARLVELGRNELARELDGAWISTIHGFCHRLLKTYPFAAGIDPRFRVLDESQARVVQSEAFADALERYCAAAEPERLRLLATYGARGLRRMVTGAFETLRSAGLPLDLPVDGESTLAPALAELRDAAVCLVGDGDATETVRDAAAGLVELLHGEPTTEQLLDLSGYAARGRAPERFETYEAARRGVERAALDDLARRDRELLQELLCAFADSYEAAKDGESALDFEDLQLVARDLLLGNDEIRERERWRLRSIMVDEFQDTNRLQCELIDLLATDELFFVGDEFQSIYRFRHADVEVFRERRERTGDVLALTENYRSRPEVLEVINHLFSADFGESFQPLNAAARFSDPAFGAAVELLVTDKSTYNGSGVHWRKAEARHVARRVRELVDTGEATPGDVVLLFAAGTDARLYEEELQGVGLPTFRATGRDYYSRQQVVDLLAYLRLLQNRYDDEALVTVLASPFVGVSNDALVLLRRAAGRRPLYAGLERSLPEDLDERDVRLFMAFRQRYERLAEQEGALSLERLCEQIVVEHDYDLAVLAQPDGRRRYANMRKLARLARSYEDLRGRNIEGFVRFVREQDSVGASELEAVAEEEDTDVVRLLTIHAAKGLEFKVVVVADAGRDRSSAWSDELLALPDGRLGFKVAHPSTGKRLAPSDYEEVKQAEEEAERAERRRLYYVAMTRAIDRLIVSGSVDPSKLATTETPIAWVLERLGPEELERAGDAPREVARGDARLVLHVDRFTEETPEAVVTAPGEEGQLSLFAPGEPMPARVEVPALPELELLPEPPTFRIRRLSYSALALFERCSYRFYAERVVGLRPRKHHVEADGGGALAATEIGDAAHALLERIDPRDPRPPSNLTAAVHARYPQATDVEVERIRSFLDAYCNSELATRLAALERVTVERPFAFELDGVLFHGRLDVLQRADGRALVVDYKTNVLDDRAPADVVEEEYRLQRLVYALACLRAGAEEVEVVYQFLERPDDVVSATFSGTERAELEAELSETIAHIQAGGFRPTPDEFVCSDCPVLGVVCAGPALRDQRRADEPAVAAVAT